MDGRLHECTICGEACFDNPGWFLILEDRWEDRLRILQWHDGLAGQPGIHLACGAAHVQELVVHWMTTGSLDHPFARSGRRKIPVPRYTSLWPRRAAGTAQRARQVCELAVHRESMTRVLGENPQSLKAVLDALVRALQPEERHRATGTQPNSGMAPAVIRGI